MEGNFIIKLGEVVSIDDEMDGGRIKVKLQEDGNRNTSELPYAFPLNPKIFHCIPQVGECVLVFTTQLNNIDSQRYYIGPVISQMQDISHSEYDYGNGSANSLLDNGIYGPRVPISEWSLTDGAFPDKGDIAVVGRNGEDIILKKGEIDLRCGVRKNLHGDEDKNLIGNVGFNGENPAYIQMKYENGLLPKGGGDGAINIVADKINLVSHKGGQSTPLVHPSSVIGDKSNPLMTKEDIGKLMEELHPLPYGDVLVRVLTIMCNAIRTHVHPFSGLPPCKSGFINAVNDEVGKLNDMLSKNIQIN